MYLVIIIPFLPCSAFIPGLVDLDVILAATGPELDGVAALHGPRDPEGWLSFEQNGPCAVIPDAQFEENILGATGGILTVLW